VTCERELGRHLCGLQLVKDEGDLRNTRVEVLPAYCTALFQPFYKRIIENFKCQYRHLWLDFIVDCNLRAQDASANVTLLHAVQWMARALRMIKNDIINDCFRKATVFGMIHGPREEAPRMGRGFAPEKSDAADSDYR